MRIILPLIFCFLSGIFTVQAQKLDFRLGFMLIQLEKDAKIDNVLDQIDVLGSRYIVVLRPVAEDAVDLDRSVLLFSKNSS